MPQPCSRLVMLDPILWAWLQHQKVFHQFFYWRKPLRKRSNFGTMVLLVSTKFQFLCAEMKNLAISPQFIIFLYKPCRFFCLEYLMDPDLRLLFFYFVKSLYILVLLNVDPLTLVKVRPIWPILPFGSCFVHSSSQSCLWLTRNENRSGY